MKPLQEFTIPVSGLKEGVHTFRYHLDWNFFSQFEASPIRQCDFEVAVRFDKRPDLYLLEFDITGVVDTACDTCLARIQLPVDGNYRLLAKFEDVEEEEADIVFIERGTTEWNIAQYLYEYVLLSVPIVHKYDCENEVPPPCDRDMISRLDQSAQQFADKQSEIWRVLQDLNIKDK